MLSSFIIKTISCKSLWAYLSLERTLFLEMLCTDLHVTQCDFDIQSLFIFYWNDETNNWRKISISYHNDAANKVNKVMFSITVTRIPSDIFLISDVCHDFSRLFYWITIISDMNKDGSWGKRRWRQNKLRKSQSWRKSYPEFCSTL